MTAEQPNPFASAAPHFSVPHTDLRITIATRSTSPVSFRKNFSTHLADLGDNVTAVAKGPGFKHCAVGASVRSPGPSPCAG